MQETSRKSLLRSFIFSSISEVNGVECRLVVTSENSGRATPLSASVMSESFIGRELPLRGWWRWFRPQYFEDIHRETTREGGFRPLTTGGLSRSWPSTAGHGRNGRFSARHCHGQYKFPRCPFYGSGCERQSAASSRESEHVRFPRNRDVSVLLSLHRASVRQNCTFKWPEPLSGETKGFMPRNRCRKFSIMLLDFNYDPLYQQKRKVS